MLLSPGLLAAIRIDQNASHAATNWLCCKAITFGKATDARSE